MPQDISFLLERLGPSLSSKIVNELIKLGISRTTARKQVSRSNGRVKRLYGIQFPNRERFLFLEEQFGKEIFKTNLATALIENNTSYGRALRGLQARGGVIPEAHFPVAGGLPVKPAKGQILASQVLARLEQLGLLKKTPGPTGELVSLWNVSSISDRRRATLIVEDITLGAVKAWLINTGWASSNAVLTRTDISPPIFGQFPFDLVGPTYLNSIIHYQKGKPVNGFIVADIVLDRNLTLYDLEPFFSKVAVLTNQRRTTRFQPLFIADWFEPEALNKLRAKGFVIARPESIFGAETAKLLHNLVATIENAAKAVTSNPAAVFDLLGKISKLEGAAFKLRGILLELIVAHLYKLQGYSIDIRQLIQSKEGERAEVDVRATNRQEVVCVECKGKSPGTLVDSPEIEDWLGRPLPRIKSWLAASADRFPYQKKRFEFYSSSGYTNDALALIDIIERTHNRQPIRFFTGQDLLCKLRENNEQALIQTFQEHFV